MFKQFAHSHAVLLLVALGARRPHGWAAAGVEEAKLNPHGIRDFSHYSAEGINLPDQMAFRDATDSRVARHLSDQVQVHGDHGGFES